MNFDFSEEQKLLQKTARDYLEESAPLSEMRAVLETRSGYSEPIWKSAAEMGWLGAAVPEEYGGAGFGHLELALLAQEVGRALAPIPFSSSVYLATEALLIAGSDAQKSRWLPALAAGECIGTFAHAEGAGRIGTQLPKTRLEDGRITGLKIPVSDGEQAGLAIVLTAAEGRGGRAEPCLALVDLADPNVSCEARQSIDPSRPQAQLRFENATAERLGEPGQGAATVSRLLDHAATLFAFEQIGGAERAFDITREFCLGRYAFGRPIASFQALKHRMADLFVDLELARSSAYYAAWALHTEGDDHAGSAGELATAACAARASATDCFELASQEMVQMHGGVGFTWEYDCHLFYRRAKLLALTIGSADEWRDRLVERLVS